MTLRRGRAAAVAVVAVATVATVGIVSQLSQDEQPAFATVDPTAAPPVPSDVRSTGGPGGEVREPVLGEIVKVTNSNPVPMPLDPHLTSMSDIKIIDQAQDVAAAMCMRSLGFTRWKADTIRTWRPEDYREFDTFEYLDPKAAADSGYPRVPAVKTAAPDARTGHEPTADEKSAFYGAAARTTAGTAVPAGGCVRQADQSIYGKAGGDLPADPRSLAVGSRSRALGDSRLREAISAWRACMQDAGITSYQHPVAAKNDPTWQSRDAGTPASAEEKRVAAADANCQLQVNLVGVYKTVRAAYEQQLLDENRAKIDESKRIFAAWVSNAKAIIKAG
ncbi:hypothetical protein GCM10010149_78410 [Nonomuraea roseoviolacea subsp. roseoviolacea]